MRVCLISREYPPETGWGGIGTFTHHLAHGLSKTGHDVHVVSLSGSATEPSCKKADGQPTVHRVPSKHLADREGFFNFCLPVTRPMLEETTALWNKFIELHSEKKFDVVECPEHFAEGLFPALCAIAPLVIRLHTPHSKLVKEKFHNFQPSFDHRILTALERVAMLSADVLISPSEDLASYVAKDLNLPLERINIVRNPVDASRFTPEGPQASMKKDAVNIIFVGRLEGRKGIHFLIEAVPNILKNHTNAHFVIIGRDTATAEGHGSVLAELKASLKQNNCEHAATFIDHIQLDEIPNYYRAADIAVLPSLYDNAPMTVIEAMACGKPVVGTSAGGTKEYVLHEMCGLIVPPQDSAALAKALSKLVGDASLRRQYGENARKNVMDRFTVEKMVADTVQLYEQAAKQFHQRHAGLYPGEPETLSQDLGSLIDSMEQTLYNMTYSNSWRFRIKHWKKRAREHPGQFLKKALSKPFSRILR